MTAFSSLGPLFDQQRRFVSVLLVLLVLVLPLPLLQLVLGVSSFARPLVVGKSYTLRSPRGDGASDEEREMDGELRVVNRRDGISANNIGTDAFVLPFFFHGHGVKLQRTPLGCFRSLLCQLLRKVPDGSPDLVAGFEDNCRIFGEPGEKWQWNLHKPQEYFRSSLEKVLEDRPVWLFIDALDECGKENAVKLIKDSKSLVQGLLRIMLPLRICFSYRHYPILDQDCQFNICLEQENRRDISNYVRTQLSASNKLTASTIPDLITQRAEGVFMWAYLVADQALNLDNDGEGLKEIEAMVNSIHPELDELYRGLVQSMDNKRASLKLTRWICFAERPLSLDELRWALVVDAVDANYPYRSLQQCEDAEDYACDCDSMERKLKMLRGGLAETVPSSKGARVVQFTHQSVKEFFLAKGLLALHDSLNSADTKVSELDFLGRTSSLLSRTWTNVLLCFQDFLIDRSSLVVGRAHYLLSRACIRYLAMEELVQSTISYRNTLRSKSPLLHYATVSWISHVDQSQAREVSQDDLLDCFAWPSESSSPKMDACSQYIPAKLRRLPTERDNYGTCSVEISADGAAADTYR